MQSKKSTPAVTSFIALCPWSHSKLSKQTIAQMDDGWQFLDFYLPSVVFGMIYKMSGFQLLSESLLVCLFAYTRDSRQNLGNIIVQRCHLPGLPSFITIMVMEKALAGTYSLFINSTHKGSQLCQLLQKNNPINIDWVRLTLVLPISGQAMRTGLFLLCYEYKFF